MIHLYKVNEDFVLQPKFQCRKKKLGIKSLSFTDRQTKKWHPLVTGLFLSAVEKAIKEPNRPFPNCCKPHYESEATAVGAQLFI